MFANTRTRTERYLLIYDNYFSITSSRKKKKRSCKAAIGYWLLQTYRFIRIDSDELKSKIDLFVLQ